MYLLLMITGKRFKRFAYNFSAYQRNDKLCIKEQLMPLIKIGRMNLQYYKIIIGPKNKNYNLTEKQNPTVLDAYNL